MRKARFIAAALVFIAASGCGSGGGGSSENDQGITFTALGVFQEEEQVAPAVDTFDPEEPQGDTGRIISLSQTTTIPNDVNGDGDLDGGYVGVRNNLTSQRITTRGIQVEIFVAGALLPNPVATDFVPLSVGLDPAPIPGEGEEGAFSEQFAQTIFVSSDVMAFLNQNRTLFPDPPFDMTITMVVEGVSDSGDNYESNQITYSVVVQD
jgi:hypothetical protein